MAAGARIPFERLPGYARWGQALDSLIDRDEPLWIHGAAGTGVSSLGTWLAERRSVAFMDDAEFQEPSVLQTWLRQNPRGVLGSHRPPDDPTLSESGSLCLALRLPTLEEEPGSLEACLESLAAEEGVTGPLPLPLKALPCPGNLRGLRNRLLRWKLLGQLPGEVGVEGSGPLPLETEDLASNLHVLERLLLHRALRRSYGNRVEAARRLGVSRRQVYLLIERHGDPVRGDVPVSEGPKRLKRSRQNSSTGGEHR